MSMSADASNPGSSDIPFPPDHLRLRVHGDTNLDAYINNGKVNCQRIQDWTRKDGVVLPQRAKVLDFGCGPGRVITWLQKERTDWQFFGTDIDPEAIKWAQENLPGIATFQCNQHMPPLDYATDTFDLVYAISIFTHLPEDMQTAWLEELSRITKPGGYLLLTTHGETLIPQEYQYVLKNGFHFSTDGKTEGLPDFYQTSYQTKEHVKRTWSKHFDIEDYYVRGLGNHQDFIVCRKRKPDQKPQQTASFGKWLMDRFRRSQS